MLYATVSRGKNRGARLLPHRFKDQRYHVQLGKQGPYIPLADSRDIPRYLANGYSLQMSGVESATPSLIRPGSIRGLRCWTLARPTICRWNASTRLWMN